MLKRLRQIFGTVFLVCGSLLFFIFTVDLSADVRIAGPMNMWPPPLWVYLILDAIFVLLSFVGMKLMRLKPIIAGYAISVVSSFALVFIAWNHVNAPPREGVSDGSYAPADAGSYAAAYIVTALTLSVGLWLIIRRAGRRKLS